MGLGGECHRMVMGYPGETPGAGLRVIFDLKAREPIEPTRPGSFPVQLERRVASVVSSIPARNPIPKARAAAL
jgi:hypothetical protein